MDLTGAITLLTVFLPIIVVTALAIRFRMGGPVLFMQQRPGRGGLPFTMLKFRTMLDATDTEGRILSDEMRLTQFGRFLRSTSLDELPGLWNVLKGDMSLVGPRPLLLSYLPLYSAEQARRHEVRPGLTGWAQVNGRNSLSWDKKFALDVWYVDHRSLALDLKILLLTIRKVLVRDGITAEGEATMPAFTGNGSDA